MLRTRLALGAALLGFWIVLMELGFTAYGFIWIYRLIHNPAVFIGPIPTIAQYLPGSILTLGCLLGGVALYQAVRGRSHWTWYAAALAPVVAILAIYRPPLGISGFDSFDATVPWMAPMYWGREGNIAFSVGLQVAMYVAAATVALAVVLALPSRHARGQDVTTVPVVGPVRTSAE